MKTPVLRLVVASAVSVSALLLLGALVVFAAPAADVSAHPALAPAGSVTARRAISVPFGIASSLSLGAGGRQVMVTGHGTCQEGGETFRVMVMVTQDATGARAHGTTTENCTGEAQTWDAQAGAVGRAGFAPGDAEACATAIVFRPHAGAVVNRWCKAVELTQP